MKKMMYLAAVALALAACSPKKTTVKGEFNPENAPAKVRITVGDKSDISVPVEDGKFEAKVMADPTVLGRIQAGFANFTFISDGSTLTVKPEEGKVVSSKSGGLQSSYNKYNDWLDGFIADYLEKIQELGEDTDEGKAFFAECKKTHDDYLKKVIKSNKDNILSVVALNNLDDEDPAEKLALINSLSSKLQEKPEVAKVKTALEAALK